MLPCRKKGSEMRRKCLASRALIGTESLSDIPTLFKKTNMALIVQKYGGTSMGSPERIKNVARRVAKWKAQGHDVVVVRTGVDPNGIEYKQDQLVAEVLQALAK